MYFGDHNPPHFHVEYGGEETLISINTLGVIHGKLPPRILGMVVEWAALHQDELLSDWQKEVYGIESEFAAKAEAELERMTEDVATAGILAAQA